MGGEGSHGVGDVQAGHYVAMSRRARSSERKSQKQRYLCEGSVVLLVATSSLSESPTTSSSHSSKLTDLANFRMLSSCSFLHWWNDAAGMDILARVRDRGYMHEIRGLPRFC